MVQKGLTLVTIFFTGLGYLLGAMAPQAAFAAETIANDQVFADPVIADDLVIAPLDFNFIVPYVRPIALDLELVDPSPPGESLLPAAPSVDLDYIYKPWVAPEIGPIEGIPNIPDILVPFDLLIIAHEDFVDELAPLKAHKDYTDIPTRIYSWQELAERFHDQGRDDQERLKKAIASFRQSCDIKYVMLVGDCDRFPVRYCMIYDPTYWGHGYSPSDLYYADLYAADGTTFDDWDGDGDGIFGEMQGGTWTAGSTLAAINLDGMDLYPDIALGRIPASTEAEVTTYVNKVISYEFAAYKASWFDKAVLVVPGYWAKDGKYYEYPGSWSAKEDVDGKLTAVGVTSTKLYDSRIEGLPAGLGNAEPTAANISAEINSGVGFVNFSGHGNTTTWGPYTSTNVAALNNAGKLPVVFAGACSTAQFHFGDSFLDVDGNTFTRSIQCPIYNDANRCWPANPIAAQCPEPAAIQGSIYDVDSMAEEFLVKRDTGGIGYIGSYTGAQGGSQVLDRYFFEGYRYSLKPATLGYLWNYAVRRYINNDFHINFNTDSAWYPQAMFHHIQKYMLFGDPSLRVGGVSRIQRADFADHYEMVHDGWQGTLHLTTASGDIVEGTPNMGGQYTASDGSEHAVRGYMRTATYPISTSWGPDHKISFYIDFSDTLNQDDDQKFDGYLFTWTKDAMAGVTWWNNIPFGFYAEKERPPVPRILANAKDDAVTVAAGGEVTIAVQLDPGVLMDDGCDWWVAASTPFGWFSFVLTTGWQAGIHTCVQSAPALLPDPIEVLKAALPSGDYTFYFALDDQQNGTLDGTIWFDSVTVKVQ